MKNKESTTIRVSYILRDALKKASRKDGRTLEAFVDRALSAVLIKK